MRCRAFRPMRSSNSLPARLRCLAEPFNMNYLNSSAFICGFGLVLGSAQAQNYPVKPVRILMGFPAGSTVDVLVRPLAQRLTETLGQQFIVDNRAGASGVIASDLVAKAPRDVSTLLGTPRSAITSSPRLSRVPFDPLRDFVSVAQIS